MRGRVSDEPCIYRCKYAGLWVYVGRNAKQEPFEIVGHREKAIDIVLDIFSY